MKNLTLLVLLCWFNKSFSLETAEPASFLQPRNFNPHPYQHGIVNINDRSLYHTTPTPINTNSISSLYSQAPIQFPTTATDQNAIKALPHPYAEVAQKKRISTLHRYSGQDAQVATPAYEALTRHAKKVLRKPKNYQQRIDGETSSDGSHYEFSYTVRDKASGDDFSHSQQQKNGAVQGSYKVQLPDGRTQVVKYTADDNGYRADVQYIEDTNGPQSQYQHTSPQVRSTSAPQVVHPNPLASAEPIYNYYKEVQLKSPIYNDYYRQNHYNSVPVTSGPIYSNNFPKSRPTYNQHNINHESVNVKTYNRAPDIPYYVTPTQVTPAQHVTQVTHHYPTSTQAPFNNGQHHQQATSFASFSLHQSKSKPKTHIIHPQANNYDYYSGQHNENINHGKFNYADYDYIANKQSNVNYVASTVVPAHRVTQPTNALYYRTSK